MKSSTYLKSIINFTLLSFVAVSCFFCCGGENSETDRKSEVAVTSTDSVARVVTSVKCAVPTGSTYLIKVSATKSDDQNYVKVADSIITLTATNQTGSSELILPLGVWDIKALLFKDEIKETPMSVSDIKRLEIQTTDEKFELDLLLEIPAENDKIIFSFTSRIDVEVSVNHTPKISEYKSTAMIKDKYLKVTSIFNVSDVEENDLCLSLANESSKKGVSIELSCTFNDIGTKIIINTEVTNSTQGDKPETCKIVHLINKDLKYSDSDNSIFIGNAKECTYTISVTDSMNLSSKVSTSFKVDTLNEDLFKNE